MAQQSTGILLCLFRMKEEMHKAIESLTANLDSKQYVLAGYPACPRYRKVTRSCPRCTLV